MSGLKITSAKKAYGDVEVLHDINLDIKKGKFIVFVGPSGCGKSTLLRMIARLEDITAGTMEIEGTVVNASRSMRARRSCICSTRPAFRCGT